MNPSCAITGANGYLGSRLVRYFETRGYTVYPMVRSPRVGHERDFAFTLGHVPRPDEFQKRKIEIFIHCAYDFAVKKWANIYRQNVKGTETLFQAAKSGGAKHLAYVSSLSAFSQSPSLYGRAKWETEQAVASLGASIVRSGLIHGNATSGILGSMEKSVLSHRVLPVITHPGKGLYLTHVDDLCELIFQLATGQLVHPDKPVIAASRHAWSLSTIARELARRGGHSILLLPIPWPFAWAGLRLLEALGITLPFRSDSIRTLSTLDRDIETDAMRVPQVHFREFKENP